VLPDYPVIIVCPAGLDISKYREVLGPMILRTVSFHEKFFSGIRNYNKLLLMQAFYKEFLDFDFMMLHHTDAFIFRDEMEYWLSRNFDNIGAPMYEYDGTLNPTKFICCGNGGLSLRKVRTFYEIAGSYRPVYRPADIWRNFLLYSWKGRVARAGYYMSMLLTLGSRMNSRFNRIKVNEDVIWSHYVPKYFEEFRNASFEDGYKFSMEFNCDKLLAMNGNRLPFGCHGWYKPLFIDFWRPHIQALGYNLE
jgi:hypothetical protein